MVDWEDKFRRLRKDEGSNNPPFPWHDVEIIEGPHGEASDELSAAPVEASTEPEVDQTEVKKSEKESMLEGLKELTEEQDKQTGEGLKFPGGVVKPAESPLESAEKIDLDASEDPEKKRVLFVYNYSTDALELEEDQREQAPSEQLLRRMIKAMKMPESDYELLVIEEGKRDLLLSKLANTSYEIVVPMGAIATNLVLDKQERISKIHGKFFSRELTYKNNQVRNFQVVPVFNPEMILINPNMKRSTWVDLQKIMEKLGIPLE